MKSFLNRMAWVSVLLALGVSCGSESALWIKLTEWPAGAENLNVVAWLNGIRHDEFSIPKDRPGFVVALPEGSDGELRLQLTAMDGDRCKVGTAAIAEALGSGLRKTHEREVQVQIYEVPRCVLSLELPSGITAVSSKPAGLVCPNETGGCEADFPKGSVVKLTPRLEPHEFEAVSVAGRNCQDGICSLLVDKSMSARFDVVPRRCSPDGFCSYQAGSPADFLRSVWGSDESNVWAVGFGGSILRWNGSIWKVEESATTEDLFSVWGSDAENIWAVGRNGTIMKWDGRVWSRQESTTTKTLRGVWGTALNSVWAVGYGPTILKWNGTLWTADPNPATKDLNAIWGTTNNNIWAVGDSGTFLRWNGTAWSVMETTSPYTNYSVYGVDRNQVWAGAAPEHILKWNGAKWETVNSAASGLAVLSVWASDTKNLWAVGQSGLILAGTEGGWVRRSSGAGTTTALSGVWGYSKNDVWVVGAAGTILRRKQ